MFVTDLGWEIILRNYIRNQHDCGPVESTGQGKSSIEVAFRLGSVEYIEYRQGSALIIVHWYLSVMNHVSSAAQLTVSPSYLSNFSRLGFHIAGAPKAKLRDWRLHVSMSSLYNIGHGMQWPPATWLRGRCPHKIFFFVVVPCLQLCIFFWSLGVSEAQRIMNCDLAVVKPLLRFRSSGIPDLESWILNVNHASLTDTCNERAMILKWNPLIT